MVKQTLTTVSLLVSMALLVANAWGLDIQDGKYEITSKVEMKGMPMQAPPVTITQCLTSQDPVPNKSAGDGQPCKVIEMKTEGKTVTWKMDCTQQGHKIQSTGKISYQGDRFDGTINTSMGPQAGGMTVTSVISGKRIGDCK